MVVRNQDGAPVPIRAPESAPVSTGDGPYGCRCISSAQVAIRDRHNHPRAQRADKRLRPPDDEGSGGAEPEARPGRVRAPARASDDSSSNEAGARACAIGCLVAECGGADAIGEARDVSADHVVAQSELAAGGDDGDSCGADDECGTEVPVCGEDEASGAEDGDAPDHRGGQRIRYGGWSRW